MEVLIGIIVVVFLVIFLSGKSGVGIKSNLIREIRTLCSQNGGSIEHPSISLEEAYKALQQFDSENKFSSNSNHYSFWVSVNEINCLIALKRIPFKKTGVELSVMTEYSLQLLKRELNIPNNLYKL